MNVVVICADYRQANLRLQPWRFISEIVAGLRRLGHTVTVVTDAAPDDAVQGCRPVRSTRLGQWGNSELVDAINAARPDVCLWNFGLTSALHFAPERIRWPSIAVFTSPVYSTKQLLRLGGPRLWLARQHAPVHLIGSLVPAILLRRTLTAFKAVIVQSEATLNALQSRDIPNDKLRLVRPAVDDDFRTPLPDNYANGSTFEISFMGSPLPVRGVFDLVDAVAIARTSGLDVRLSVLSRNRGEHDIYERHLQWHVARRGVREAVAIRTGFLSRHQLIEELSRSHVIALPFQIIPSDAPLAVLEGMSLGRPIIGTRVGSLTEYLAAGRGYVAEPGRPYNLADSITQAATSPTELSTTRAKTLCAARQFPTWTIVAETVGSILVEQLDSKR